MNQGIFEQPIKDFPPLCRKGAHCGSFIDNYENNFMIYGGQVGKLSMRNDTWVHFDNWKILNYPNDEPLAPRKRWKGTLTSHDNSSNFYLFGGSDVLSESINGDLNEILFNDLWKFEISTSTWIELLTDENQPNRPSKRRAHTSVIFKSISLLFRIHLVKMEMNSSFLVERMKKIKS